MIKFKWRWPFTPFWVFATPVPPDVPTRWLVVCGTLAMTVAALAVVQPWRIDPPVKRQGGRS